MKRLKKPKVSVIIPTHNRSELLLNSVLSVLKQTFDNYEIIIIDDHSVDDTKNVVNNIGDKRIRYFKNDGKNGPSVARNLGIKNAAGKYIAFLDDDDEWIPQKLEKQIHQFDSCGKNICGIYSNRLMVNKQTGKTFSDNIGESKLKGNLLTQLLKTNPIHTSTLVVRKSCLDKIGLFDEKMRYMEDRDAWTKLSMYWDFEYIPEALTKAYYHGNSHLSYNLEGQTQGRQIFLSRYHYLLKKNKKNYSDFHISIGAQYCQLGQMKKGRNYLTRGIFIYPINVISYFHFLFSLFGHKNYQRLRSLKSFGK